MSLPKPGSKHWRVEVEWQDSTLLHEGWTDIDDVLGRRGAVTCLSVGFVLADDRQGMVLAASVHAGQVAGVTMIPRKAIVSKRRLT